MRHHPDRRALAVAVGVVLVFLAATQRWTAPKVWANDAFSYGLMSRAAPGLPKPDTVGSAYAGRFFPHYLVGLVSDGLGLSLHAAYWVVASVAVVALAIVVAVILAELDIPLAVAVLVLAAFVAQPYTTPRETLLAPGLVQDLVFVLGLGVCLLGLVRVRFGVVLVGVLVALAGRQTALLVLPVVAAWLLLDEPWRALPLRRRQAQAAAVVVAGVALYAVILAITSSFSYHFAPDGFGDTLLGSPPSAKALVSHVGRTAIPSLVPAVVLLATAFLLWRDGLPPARLPRRIWLLLALWAVVVVQPLAISPEFPGFAFNEQRLSGVGLLPLYLAVAIALREAVARGALRVPRRWLYLAAAAVVVASLSHINSSVGPRSLAQFLVLQVLAAAVLGGVVIAAGGRRRLPSPA